MTNTAEVPTDRSAMASVFGRIASLLYESDDFEAIYQALCDAAVDLIPGCHHASLMTKDGDRFVTAAASDAVARRADELERELGDGPCVDSIVEQEPQLDPDLTVNPSWPRLAGALLAETPVRGSAAFRLVVDGKKAGALNIFCDAPDEITVETVNQGALLAAFASVTLMAVANRHEAVTLRDGLVSNREIGQAQGLIMGYNKMSAGEAFELLKDSSQKMNLRLAMLARQVVQQQNETAAREARS